MRIDGKRILMVHSTPWEPRGSYVLPTSSELERFGEADADIVLQHGDRDQRIAQHIEHRLGRATEMRQPAAMVDGEEAHEAAAALARLEDPLEVGRVLGLGRNHREPFLDAAGGALERGDHLVERLRADMLVMLHDNVGDHSQLLRTARASFDNDRYN